MKYLLILIIFLLSMSASAAPGDLDTSFGSNGIVLTEVVGSLEPFDTIVQPDGKTIVVGAANVSPAFVSDFFVARYNIDGTLDTSFDSDGIALIDIGGIYTEDTATSVAILSDGRIVVGGYSYSPNTERLDFTLVRLHTNGSLDASFDIDGRVATQVTNRDDRIEDIDIQTDGKIVAAGRANSDFGVVRYNADGSLDATFGAGSGMFLFDVQNGSASVDNATGLAIQPDGLILVSGTSGLAGNNDFAVIRVLADGSDVDMTFDGDGVARTDLGGTTEQSHSMVLQTDGKIILVGGSAGNITLVRYNTDGSLDPSFDVDGIVTTNIPLFSSSASDVVVAGDGRIMISASRFNGNGSDYVVIRYLANGALDSFWGPAGVVITDLGTIDEFTQAIAIAPSGKIVVAGRSNVRAGIVRYHNSGGYTFSTALLTTTNSSRQIVKFPGDVLPYESQLFTSGLLMPSNPHGLAPSGPDEALVTDFLASRIYVVRPSTNSIASILDTSASGYDGTGTIAVSPDGSYALAMGGSDQKLYRIAAPFNSGSAVTSIDMPSSIPNFQTQAIVFGPGGRAFIQHLLGVSVVDPPYNAVAFTMTVNNFSGGALAISPDGDTLLTTQMGGLIRIFNAPFSASSTPVDLFVGVESADGIAITPDGAKAVVVDNSVKRAVAISAPFTAASAVEQIPMPAGSVTEGFEHVAISPDGQLAILTGQSFISPPVFIRAPFGVNSVTYNVPIAQPDASRGAGAVGFLPFAPSAAAVSISGRLVTTDGVGVSNAVIALTDMHGSVRSSRSNAFGYFRFDEVEAGQHYIVTPTHKRYQFDPTSRTINVVDEIRDADFTGGGGESTRQNRSAH